MLYAQTLGIFSKVIVLFEKIVFNTSLKKKLF